jgi:hypothetical protein
MSPRIPFTFILVRCLAAAIAFYATTRQPYDFYIFTRWAVFLTCCWGIWLCRGRIWPSFAPAYFVIGLVFNPLLPFHFQRSNWQVLDAVAGIVLLASIFLHRSTHYSKNPNA